MKYLIGIMICFIGIAAFAQSKYNPTLKRQLDSVMVLDQKYRDTLTLLMTPDKANATAKPMGINIGAAINHYWKLQKAIDSTNTLFVEAIFKRYGYPGKTLVGDSTSEAAWYVIQHSKKIDDYLPLIKKAAEARELPFKLYAMMLDRYLMNKNQEQIYGTQATMRKLKASGKSEWFIWPIKDAETVNQRRKDAGFPDTVEANAKRLGVEYKVLKLSEVI